MRLVVASSATALAPFSQNSATCRLSPSGHAHPGQSIPSFWFTFSSVSAVRLTPICWYDCFSAAVTPGIPAASSFGCDTSRPRSSGSWIGGLPHILHPHELFITQAAPLLRSVAPVAGPPGDHLAPTTPSRCVPPGPPPTHAY